MQPFDLYWIILVVASYVSQFNFTLVTFLNYTRRQIFFLVLKLGTSYL